MANITPPKRLYVFVLWGIAVCVAVLFQYLPNLINPAHSILNARFKTLWLQPVEKLLSTTPVIAGERLVYGTSDGHLFGASLENGETVWSLKLPDGIYAISKEGDVVYASTGSHFSVKATLAAVEAATGQILWQTEFDGHLEEQLRADAKTHQLWVGGGPSGLWSVDSRDGKILWHKALGHLDGTPLLHEGMLYIPAQKDEATHESFFYALRAKDGTTLWQKEQPGQPWAAPVMDKTGHVIFTTTARGQIGVKRETDQGWAQAFSVSGDLLWQTDLPAMALTPGIYLSDLDLIVYTTKGAGIVALGALDGKIVWQAIPETEFYASAVMVEHFKERLIAATTSGGVFYLLDARSGTVSYSLKTGIQSYAAPVVQNEIIYVPSSHNITAFRNE